jgi:hypothetical protein
MKRTLDRGCLTRTTLRNFERWKAHNQGVVAFIEKLLSREIFFETHESTAYLQTQLMNLNASRCYSCGKIAVWRADELIYPINHISIAPNEGMRPDVKMDFLEANKILDKSPRGAAALLRLCIQKLIIHLGEEKAKI